MIRLILELRDCHEKIQKGVDTTAPHGTEPEKVMCVVALAIPMARHNGQTLILNKEPQGRITVDLASRVLKRRVFRSPGRRGCQVGRKSDPSPVFTFDAYGSGRGNQRFSQGRATASKPNLDLIPHPVNTPG